ncbi:MAG TPA: hypothetical protein VIW24_17430 [Aldersonia sp.]
MRTGLLVSEFRKVFTLNFWWALLIAPLVVGMFASAIYAAIADGLGAYDSGANDNDGLSTGLASAGLYFALVWVVLFAGIFGAINAGTDFRHKTITPTLLVTPRRDPVVATKLLVTVVVALGYVLVVEAASLACLAVFGGGSIRWGLMLLGVLATGIAATVCWALIGAGLGLLLGSPVGAALLLVSWYVVGEITVALILTGIGLDGLAVWLPGAATLGTVAIRSTDDFLLTWPVAPLVLLAWTALFAGGGWWLTRRRDIT